MTISPELRAKIDALEDEGLKERILRVLTGPGKKRVSDEVIYENALASHIMATEQQAKLRKWTEDEVATFAQHFKRKDPDSYVEFLRQEEQFNEIESLLGWKARCLIWEWIPGLDESDSTSLFRKFRDYAKSDSS
ncbi:hypothetical protein [Lysobacter capsici]|uniref:hypothetical protein n=1 Tax=Lysobacter capsici TaxID=435897 RepID=UPI00044D44DD|nr:hypothetical protein [Lysobacter capsici]